MQNDGRVVRLKTGGWKYFPPPVVPENLQHVPAALRALASRINARRAELINLAEQGHLEAANALFA